MYSALQNECNHLCLLASKSSETYFEIKIELSKLTFSTEKKFKKQDGQPTQPPSHCDAKRAGFVKDPHLVKTKGSQGHNNDKATRRRCGYCKEYGHTKPMCELFRNSKCTAGNPIDEENHK